MNKQDKKLLSDLKAEITSSIRRLMKNGISPKVILLNHYDHMLLKMDYKGYDSACHYAYKTTPPTWSGVHTVTDLYIEKGLPKVYGE